MNSPCIRVTRRSLVVAILMLAVAGLHGEVTTGNLEVNGDLAVDGADLTLGLNDGRSIGTNTQQRALVHNSDDSLVVNWGGDFEGGVVVSGPKLETQGPAYFDSNVGIMTTNPSAVLDVNGTIAISSSDPYLQLNDDTKGLCLSGGAGWVNHGALIRLAGNQSTWDPDGMEFYTGGLQSVEILANGNMGIGTATPDQKLTITGGGISVDAGQALRIGGVWALAGDGQTTYVRGQYIAFQNASTLATPLFIDKTGDVGVGTTSPTNKFEVNGTIRAKEVIVEANNWPDYVFAKGAPQPSLANWQKSIDTQGHLPGIPSAADVKKNDGVGVGEMQKAMLEKIEQLSLIVIKQQKRLQAAEAQIRQLQQTVNSGQRPSQ